MEIKVVKSYIALLVVIVVLFVANLIMTSMLFIKPAAQTQCTEKSRSLPCESVPLDWAVANYECANSLLRAMNVTNLKFI